MFADFTLMLQQITNGIRNSLVFSLVFIVFFSSCKSSKEVAYFNHLGDTIFVNKGDNSIEPLIQKNDLLSITITSLNPEATVIFNTLPATTATSLTTVGNTSPTGGYLVDRSGAIQLPVLGNMMAAGLTKNQLRDTIVARITRDKLLIDPVVSIRFLNFRVTVLGEVARPTVISVPNEKITILEALAQAGDLTIYGRRDNLLLVREENNQKITKRINLNSSEIFSSPYYYLKANDIIYAEPNSSKVASASSTRQMLPIILSGLSFLVIIIDRILRAN